jgi:D-apionolactonase
MTPELRIKAYGSPDLPPKQIFLKAGQLELTYENGSIRWIRFGNTEILRMIYSAVRDRNWGTIEPKIEEEVLEINENTFDIKLRVNYQADPIHFVADYHISGEPNKIRFEMQGTAQSTFLKNRIGFCVLHPIAECAGQEAKVFHPDGSRTDFTFPQQIAAHQPVRNIQSIQWNPAQGMTATLNFSGDLFEMEDQRNWTDASFKTYCTPLGLPFPAEIKKGETVTQLVELTVETERTTENPDREFVFSWNPEKVYQLLELGTSLSSRKENLTQSEIKLLKKLPSQHLRIELHMIQSNFRQLLEKATNESHELGWPLFVVLYLSENYREEYQQFAAVCNDLRTTVKYLLPLDENHLSFPEFEHLEPQIRQDFPGIQLGTGVNAYFAELNRSRPTIEKADFVSFTICPQVHAFDCASLVENLAAQAEVVWSAKKLFSGKPIFISPVSLKQRFNVVATEAEAESAAGILPSSVDVRQPSLFAANWTLGSLKFLAQSGASLITYFETVGWKGMIHGEIQADCPEKFRSKAKDNFPIFGALKELSGFSEVIQSVSSNPLLFDGLVVKTELETKLFLFSFSSEELEIRMNFGIQPKAMRSMLYPQIPEYSGGKIKLKAWDLLIILI